MTTTGKADRYGIIIFPFHIQNSSLKSHSDNLDYFWLTLFHFYVYQQQPVQTPCIAISPFSFSVSIPVSIVYVLWSPICLAYNDLVMHTPFRQDSLH